MQDFDLLQPGGWPRPRGYSNGIAASGRLVVLSGMIGWDENEHFPSSLFIDQARQALHNIVVLLKEADAGPQHLVRLTWYIVDLAEYRSSRQALGQAYRDIIGAHYPTMTAVQVAGLVEPEARLEIEATAVLPLADPERQASQG